LAFRRKEKMKSLVLMVLALFATLSTLAVSPPHIQMTTASSLTVVTFDNLPNGTAIPSMIVITNQFAEWNVTFTPFKVYNLSEVEPSFAAVTSNYSKPNVGALTPNPIIAPYNFTNFIASFTMPVNFVSLKVGNTEIGSIAGNLTAFDKDGKPLSSVQLVTSDLNFNTISIMQPLPNIAYVQFRASEDGSDIDDFTFGTVEVPPVGAKVDIDPDALNLRSQGMWITTYIELPKGYNVSDINVSSIMLNAMIHAESRPVAIGDYDSDTIPDLMVKFSRSEVTAFVFSNAGITEGRFGNATLTITGRLNDGTPFEGSDTIKIIMFVPPQQGKPGSHR
jgi:hypothetical protein